MDNIPPYDNEEKRLTFVGHLEELRIRIIHSLVAIILATVFAYHFREAILKFLLAPVGKTVFIGPLEAFMASIKVALFSGLLISSPYIVLQLWQFIAAGLKKQERRYAGRFAVLSFMLFITGAIFGYVVILPLAMKFLLGFGNGLMVPMISVGRYISFAAMLSLAFSLIFQVPLAMLFLTKIGIVNPAFLRQKRKYAIVGIFIISALLTPPDVLTQCLMAIPLLLLYEIGLFFSRRA